MTQSQPPPSSSQSDPTARRLGVITGSRRRRAVFFFAYCFILLLLALGTAELAVRVKGLKPWNPVDPGITVEPAGRLFQRHPIVGYAHLPGAYTITLPDGYSFRVTHGQDSTRITHPESDVHEGREGLWIFGCSYTYGWSVDDDETYSWLLQQRLPQYEVKNFAVNGYGTLHGYLQLRDALEQGRRPKIAIVAYASFHDERNVFARIVRKYIVPWNRLGPMLQPYARLNPDGTFRYAMADFVYREFPLMRYSAFVNYLETEYDRHEFHSLQSHAVSEAILREMERLAQTHGTRLIVGDIGFPPTIMDFARQEGIEAVDISVDPSLPGNTNQPHDHHPSAAAHRHYAEKLAGVITSSAAEPAPELSYLLMSAPEAENQIVKGVFGLEDNSWRWMSGQAVIRLKKPTHPAPLKASLFLPDQAPGRKVALSVNGVLVAESVLPGPGNHLITSASPVNVATDAATVSITVDRTFSPPGDSRELGLILNAVGFRE